MKICPLVTQAIVLEEEDKSLLVREADSDDLEESNDEQSEQEDQHEEQDNDQSIFLNPEVEPSDPAIEDEYGFDIAAEGRPVRFVAKAYRGEVECLGEHCRFFNEEGHTCRIESLFSIDGRTDSMDEQKISEIMMGLDKIGELQQKSTGDVLARVQQQEELTNGIGDSLNESLEHRMGELRELLTSVIEENKVIVESISDTLAEKIGDIEEKLAASGQHIEGFRTEISSWKEGLDRSLEALSNGLDENGRFIKDLSRNHTEIVEIVENQKKSFEAEEKKRQQDEAKRLNNAGVVAYHNGQYERALELFQKAIQLNPEFTEGYNNLGLTYTEMAQEEKATEAFKKAIELNPNLSATYNNLGYAFYRLGSYTEAIEMYQEAIGRSNDNSAAYTNLGNAYYKLDRIDEAIEAWNTAIRIDPSNEKARRNLKRFNAEVRENG
ncbi:MAG TPA: tetratricopeptide repeat protein [Patescibacteria group bacterium]|nr:tetratricopeptide repeat protein [Patescibacteria group bacterium]